MTRLRTLRIHRFRWVTPGTELTFADGVNLILGRNGTGKTTLLELLAAVWSGDFSAYREESFDVEAEFGLGDVGWVRMRVENQRVGREEGFDAGPVSMAKLGLSRDSNWEWSVSVEAEYVVGGRVERFLVEATRGTLHLNGEPIAERHILPDPFVGDNIVIVAIVITCLRMRWEPGQKLNELPPMRLLDEVPKPSLRGGQRRFPEDGMWMTVAAQLLTLEAQFRTDPKVHPLVHLTYPQVRITEVVPLEGLLEQVNHRLRVSEALPTMLSFDRETLPSLGRIADTLAMANVELTLALRVGEAPLDLFQGRPFSYEEPTFHFTKRDGSRIPLKSLSYGQKRLFAFLLYVDSSPQVIIADELANGLHYAMLEEVLKLISDRQCFLAMQDPLILDHVLLESPEHVQRAIVTCTIVPEGARDRWRWSQPTPEEAADLFGAFQVGIQHTSEILKTRGLW